MFADFHFHGRDWDESHKDTLEYIVALAKACGIDVVGLMGNTKPPLLSGEAVRSYLSRAPKSSVRLFAHLVLTNDLEQCRRAVDDAMSFPEVCGLKAYWTDSTNNMGINEEDNQLEVLSVVKSAGFKGVLVGHYEDSAFINDALFDPKDQSSWSTKCRPEVSEMSSFRKICAMAKSLGLEAKMHVAHTSTPYVVHEASRHNRSENVSFSYSCGLTPHHLLFDTSHLAGPDGVNFKCNPPLRSPSTRENLLWLLLNYSRSDLKPYEVSNVPDVPLIIESDHAPHTHADKHPQSGLPASGIPSGILWPVFVEVLRHRGMSEQVIRKVTFDNAVNLYGVDVEYSERSVDWKRLDELGIKYSSVFNPSTAELFFR